MTEFRMFRVYPVYVTLILFWYSCLKGISLASFLFTRTRCGTNKKGHSCRVCFWIISLDLAVLKYSLNLRVCCKQGRSISFTLFMNYLPCCEIYDSSATLPHISAMCRIFVMQNPRKRGQWLSGRSRVLDSRGRGRGFEPHRRNCVVVLEQDTFILA